jgi:hypothetical protein
MSKFSILSGFNAHLIELFDDVTRLFPNDQDIRTAKTAILAIKKANPRLIITTWDECITQPYRDEIEKGDMHFLINKDYNEDLSIYDTDNTIRDKIETLRQPMQEMGKENQNKVVQYFQNLTKLSDMYKKSI